MKKTLAAFVTIFVFVIFVTAQSRTFNDVAMAKVVTISCIDNGVNVNGVASLNITIETNPLVNSIRKFNSKASWSLNNTQAQDTRNSHLKYINTNEAIVFNGSNCCVPIYKNRSKVMPSSMGLACFSVYTGESVLRRAESCS